MAIDENKLTFSSAVSKVAIKAFDFKMIMKFAIEGVANLDPVDDKPKFDAVRVRLQNEALDFVQGAKQQLRKMQVSGVAPELIAKATENVVKLSENISYLSALDVKDYAGHEKHPFHKDVVDGIATARKVRDDMRNDMLGIKAEPESLEMAR